MSAAPRLLRVPEITAFFWIIKGLSTALGESTSDFLVRACLTVGKRDVQRQRSA